MNDKVKIITIKPGFSGYDGEKLETKIITFLEENKESIEVINISIAAAENTALALIHYRSK
ncbi:hypothetical protein KC909_04515 [Candidatus Dojkabacteria bacterium]|uniref:Uncharacterized protein n=1 Tax=Candidatus Dojkabacteria bacterium TaxID=2099670 RepID=A0A955RJ52_9BACT|nr:hypothetical protein [Candidatus Dojkabacteria bacterium]